MIKTDIKMLDVVGILIADDDNDGYEADPVEAKRLTQALFDLMEDNTSADDVAEFVYTYMKWMN